MSELTPKEIWAKLNGPCWWCQVEGTLDHFGFYGTSPDVTVREFDELKFCDRHDVWMHNVIQEALANDHDLQWFSTPPDHQNE